jgi:hypothetical protein
MLLMLEFFRRHVVIFFGVYRLVGILGSDGFIIVLGFHGLFLHYRLLAPFALIDCVTFILAPVHGGFFSQIN